jgi:ABC-2 type transport system ATP-binding protein
MDDPVIVATGLRKRYGSTLAVDGADLVVRRGEIFGLLGRNGAGKTTTVEMVAGLRTPDAGSVRVLGLDPAHDRDRLRRVVGLQLQHAELQAKITVREALDLFASFYPDPEDPEPLIERLGLAEKAGTRFEKLSGGQKQRLSVALALVGRPQVAILDELTTGLDPHARRDAWEVVRAVRDSGVTIVLVTHLMEEAERLCDTIAVMARGAVVAVGSPAELRERASGWQTLSFVPDAPVPASLLEEMPGVRSVRVVDERTEVTGGGRFVQDVLAGLAARGVGADRVQMSGATLEDAFLTLTGSDDDEEVAA